MSTYRKFDKWRARADFLSDIEFGIDTPANKWIATGTGTPAVAIAANGLSLATSAAGPDTTFIQRGIISAATKSEPLTIAEGQKFHIVASLEVPDAPDFNVLMGFANAAANPAAEAARVLLKYEPGQFIAELGASKSRTLVASPVEFIKDGILDLEIYYDGTNKVQYYAGGKRVAQLEAAFTNGLSTDAAGALSPTLGVQNDGVAAAHTIVARAFGYAIQRAPTRSFAEV